MLSTLVIDDELLAREELISLIEDYQELNVIGEASNAIEGLKKINQLKPDVVFLDIHMPQISGMELLSMLDPDSMPFVIFVTAYDQYAIQAFEDNAFDYLLKPIQEERFSKTIKKLLKRTNLQQNTAAIVPKSLEQIPCVGLNRILVIPTVDIEFAFSDISGVHIKTTSQTATSQLTLKQLEDKTSLIRCHRQYLVSAKAIKEIKLLDNGLAEIVTHGNNSVPVSRRYLKTIKETIGISG
ncbi:two-component system response regulator BtsR [Vibrio viridaestus]|uniref:Two-component system response regulator YehT n=1 Tax=Vibrio viridaestus TaxID=2487322 RepID=A0A3N9TFQ1_9VIBR|nr:two-component system response regulator BtsR [Vibrio viridaestus]RQW63071.1 two-component system response regulator YehT [Vibrio viridaestus]